MTTPLISPDELAVLMASGDPLTILDVTYYLGQAGRGRHEHEQAHLPGAVFVDVETELTGDHRADGAGGRHPLPTHARLQAVLRSAGVQEGRPIIVHDAGDGQGAGRAWWLLTEAGVADLRVLDGGLRAWQRAGQPTTRDDAPVEVGDITLRPGGLPRVSAADVPAHLARGGRVVDVRAAERFRGEKEPQ